MFKKCFAILIAFLFLGSISVVIAANTKVMHLPALQRTTDTGYVRPDRDNTIDLGVGGATPYEFRNAYFDGTVKTDVLVVDENATIAQFLGNTRIDINVTDGTSIPVTGTFCNLIATGSYTMLTNVIQIAFTNASEGDYLVLTTTGTDTLTFTEGATTGLRLGSGTRAVGQYDTLRLIYVSTGTGDTASYWQEISHITN